MFGFVALQAVILNKAMSLVVVTSGLLFRIGTVPTQEIAANWSTIVNLLAGSLLGAWLGAAWATRLSKHRLCQVISIMMAAIAAVLLFSHSVHSDDAMLQGHAQVVVRTWVDFPR